MRCDGEQTSLTLFEVAKFSAANAAAANSRGRQIILRADARSYLRLSLRHEGSSRRSVMATFARRPSLCARGGGLMRNLN